MQLSLTSTNVWIADRAIDFRKSIDGLCDLVHHAFERNPADGIFVFYNRQRNKVKVLAWHGNGFVMIYKKLEQGKFTVNTSGEGLAKLDSKQLSWLLAGLDWEAMSSWNTLEYDDYN